MPILPAEPDRYPADLFSGDPAGGECAWWVLHTKPRQEKSLARHLQAAGVGYFLPAVARRTAGDMPMPPDFSRGYTSIYELQGDAAKT